MLTAMSSKNILRAKMLDTRSQLGPDKISQFNREICKNLSFVWTLAGGLGSGSAARNSDLKPNRPLWAGYKSFRWEADPQEAIELSMKYLRWAFPRIIGKQEKEFLIPAEADALWTKNSYGIWEPKPETSQKISLDQCVGVLVPGVAFDRLGHRLGYGKGFYDRSLKDFKGLKVGVCFSVQLVDENIPFDDLDVGMDILVTDKEILHITDVTKH